MSACDRGTPGCRTPHDFCTLWPCENTPVRPGALRWNTLHDGLHRSDAFDEERNRVPFRYTARRSADGRWQLTVEDVHHSLGPSLATIKAIAEAHHREAATLH